MPPEAAGLPVILTSPVTVKEPTLPALLLIVVCPPVMFKVPPTAQDCAIEDLLTSKVPPFWSKFPVIVKVISALANAPAI